MMPRPAQHRGLPRPPRAPQAVRRNLGPLLLATLIVSGIIVTMAYRAAELWILRGH